MSISEYIDNLRRLKKLAVDRWGNLTQTESAIVEGSFEWLVENLELKEGIVVPDEKLAAKMDEFLSAVKEIIQKDKNFRSKIKDFVSDLGRIKNNIRDFHSAFHGLNIETVLAVTNVQQAVVSEVLNQYLDNGLNVHFVAPLREAIFRNILVGANLREVRQRLKEYVLSGQDGSGKFQRYVHNTAIQAVDTYTGAINKKLVETFKFTGYIISGSLIETSSEQCIYAVENSKGGYLTMKEWEEVLEIARNNERAKLIKGTTLENLPLNRLHWGCRHDFTPTIRKEAGKKPPSDGPRPKPGPSPEPTPPPKPKKPREQGKTTKQSEIQRAGRILQEMGLTMNASRVSSKLSLEGLTARINQFERLAKDYEIARVYNPAQPTKLSFASSQKYGGFIKTNNFGTTLLEINLGSQDTNIRATQVNLEAVRARFLSKVDPENIGLSTTTHEFAHVITTRRQTSTGTADPRIVPFWKELEALRQDYFFELKKYNRYLDLEEYDKIHLGDYAATNENEFMAEAFTEYKLTSKPSKYAKLVGELIDKYFKRK